MLPCIGDFYFFFIFFIHFSICRVVQTGGTGGIERGDGTSSEAQTTAGAVWNTMTSLTKQRVKLNMKLLGQFTGQQPNMKEDKPTYREQFVSPQMSMVSYFLMKVGYPS